MNNDWPDGHWIERPWWWQVPVVRVSGSPRASGVKWKTLSLKKRAKARK